MKKLTHNYKTALDYGIQISIPLGALLYVIIWGHQDIEYVYRAFFVNIVFILTIFTGLPCLDFFVNKNYSLRGLFAICTGLPLFWVGTYMIVSDYIHITHIDHLVWLYCIFHALFALYKLNSLALKNNTIRAEYKKIIIEFMVTVIILFSLWTAWSCETISHWDFVWFGTILSSLALICITTFFHAHSYKKIRWIDSFANTMLYIFLLSLFVNMLILEYCGV